MAFIAFTSCKNGESVFSKNKSDRPSPPVMTQGNIGSVNIKIEYSSPRVRGREIWGELVPYHNLWRTGANEATIISVSGDLMLEGQFLPKGKYSLFTIPAEDSWTILINKEWDLWGSYDYDEKKNVLSIKVNSVKLSQTVENMTFSIVDDHIKFMWEKVGFNILAEAVAK